MALSKSKSSSKVGSYSQADILSKRFDGSKEKLEVWYDTFSDEQLDAGFWIHHELVSPVNGEPYVHGWFGYFFNKEQDAPNSQVGFERFGPESVVDSPYFECLDTVLAPNLRKGKTSDIKWDLTTSDFKDKPVFTFGKLAWEKEILPSCQIVGGPNITYDGTVIIANKSYKVSNAKGALSRIYGHGNAKRWAWLHADLDGSNMIEIVSAVSTKPGLDKLKPLGFIQLRFKDEDWPSNPLVAFPFFRTKMPGRQLGDNSWSIKGRYGDYRIDVNVNLPGFKSIAVDYTDPDGKSAVCVNTEIGDVDILLEQKISNRWVQIKHWQIENRAHCEMGFR